MLVGDYGHARLALQKVLVAFPHNARNSGQSVPECQELGVKCPRKLGTRGKVSHNARNSGQSVTTSVCRDCQHLIKKRRMVAQ